MTTERNTDITVANRVISTNRQTASFQRTTRSNAQDAKDFVYRSHIKIVWREEQRDDGFNVDFELGERRRSVVEALLVAEVLDDLFENRRRNCLQLDAWHRAWGGWWVVTVAQAWNVSQTKRNALQRSTLFGEQHLTDT
jgi:hypothetical protein